MSATKTKDESKPFTWPTGGGLYHFLTDEDKTAMIASGQTFYVIAVATETNDQLGARELFILSDTSIDENGVTRNNVLSFAAGTVDSRSRLLGAMASHFEQGGDPIAAKLEEQGRARVIVPA